MPRYVSYDGTEIAYHLVGDGPPLVCLPGGPGRATDYLGDLGGLSGSRQLVLLDPRGVGQSADPADPATFRVDRLVNDVESLRVQLGLNRMDLLAHSAGSILATLYAAAHPEQLSALVLVTPGLGAIGIEGTEEQFDAVLARVTDEPWYPAAMAALRRLAAGELSLEAFRESRPLFYGRWDETAQAHATAGVAMRHQAARLGYFGEGAFDVTATRSALKGLTAPVLLYAGDLDPLVTPATVREAVPVFSNATVVVQPGAGHFPWIDDPAAFATAINSFLG
jgi:pimeloyl-ACP methyl ester carboxylesterase